MLGRLLCIIDRRRRVVRLGRKHRTFSRGGGVKRAFAVCTPFRLHDGRPECFDLAFGADHALAEGPREVMVVIQSTFRRPWGVARIRLTQTCALCRLGRLQCRFSLGLAGPSVRFAHQVRVCSPSFAKLGQSAGLVACIAGGPCGGWSQSVCGWVEAGRGTQCRFVATLGAISSCKWSVGGQIRLKSANVWPDPAVFLISAKVCPNSTEIGRCLPLLGKIRSNFGDVGRISVNFWPDMCPNSTNFDRGCLMSAKRGLISVKLGRSRSNLARFRPCVGQILLNLRRVSAINM